MCSRIIDTRSFKKVGDIPGLPGDSNEGMVIDRAGKKLRCNLTGSDEVGVIDLNSRQLVDNSPAERARRVHDRLGRT